MVDVAHTTVLLIFALLGGGFSIIAQVLLTPLDNSINLFTNIMVKVKSFIDLCLKLIMSLFNKPDDDQATLMHQIVLILSGTILLMLLIILIISYEASSSFGSLGWLFLWFLLLLVLLPAGVKLGLYLWRRRAAAMKSE
jgi:hypothetical protein